MMMMMMMDLSEINNSAGRRPQRIGCCCFASRLAIGFLLDIPTAR